MLRTFKKRLTPVDLYEIRGNLDGHLFSYGRIGAGKSVSLLSLIQGFHDMHNYKILDIFGGERNEGLYWCLPNQDTGYWNKVGILGKFDEEGAKQYKVNLLYPFFLSKLPKKLPKKPSWVNSKVFTIPLKSLIPEDVSVVIGNPSETSKYELNEILYKINKKVNSGNLIEIIDDLKMKTLKSTLFYKNFLLPLVREKFLMDSYCDYNLDLIEEMRDRETISVLCLDFVPDQFKIFIINYILRNVVDLLEENKIGKKNILFMRESATFFRATENSVVEDRFKIFRTLLSNYLRMGRRGTYFALDCQSPFETKGLVQGSEDFLLMFKTTAWRDKLEMCDELKRERRMRQEQVANLAFLEPGQCYIAETGRNVKKVQITLPRTMYWKKEYGNFYKNVWERFGGEWLNTEEIKDYIIEKCDSALKPINKSEKSLNQSSEQAEIKPVLISNESPKIQEQNIIKPANISLKEQKRLEAIKENRRILEKAERLLKIRL